MIDTPADSAADQDLRLLHERLDAHFFDLRRQRDRDAHGAPLFALEHGLSEGELALLRARICDTIHRGRLPPGAWLPLVVYAAEVGYTYSGDEYWQTFESRTPGWAEHGDRQYIRRRFREFASRFGGAEPSGAWAGHFTIICWPITHAVLPTDLQRYVARLLFDYRRALTSDLLEDPTELGRVLAARSWHASSRFQNFAQNTNLLGQVATALLIGDDEESPYLVDATLRRIVADISRERQARVWLRDAKYSATQLRLRGFRQLHRGARDPNAPSQNRPLVASDPGLSLRVRDGHWAVFLELPDLSLLVERFPGVGEELARRRAIFAGADGSPLARRGLLYPGQRILLSDWPAENVPLVQLEGGSTETNSLLSNQCALSPGPPWLFRVRDPGLASEVRGKQVRPGREYVLLSDGTGVRDPPSWVTQTRCGTAGIEAHTMHVPATFESNHIQALRAMGIGAITDVEIRPAGVVPSMWDGEGHAEWLAGEDPILVISSTRTVERCIFVVDSEPQIVDWPAGRTQLFVRVDDLAVGNHDLGATLHFDDKGQTVAEGKFKIAIRPPHTRPTSGSFREGLMILTTPVSPTLAELWDGKAAFEIRGPVQADVRVEIQLADGNYAVLARRQLETKLPLDVERWCGLFSSQIRGAKELRGAYDDAESCVVVVSHPALGTVSLRCAREFAPLRWATGHDRDGPFVRLIDNAEGAPAEIAIFEFATPAQPTTPGVERGSRVRSDNGGLVVATAGGATARVILAREVRDLGDLRQLIVTPELPTLPRSRQGVLRLVELAQDWGAAVLPGDPFGESGRDRVLRAIVSRLAGLIGGERWARLEDRLACDGREPTLRDLEDGVGEAPYQRALARELVGGLDALRSVSVRERVKPFADVLAKHVDRGGIRRGDLQLVEMVLRLASQPSTVLSWEPEALAADLDLVLDAPVLLRTARFVVLAIDGADAAQGGWVWE